MQPKLSSIKRREKCDVAELRPAAHWDASGILKVPPAGKTGIPPGLLYPGRI